MRLGIIGAGQLGRMLALAGYPLGMSFVFLDRSIDAPGGQVGSLIVGAFDDPGKLGELADLCDTVTFDVENVPVEAVRPIAERVRFLPPVVALEAAQDRLAEKALFATLAIPTPEYRPVADPDDLRAAASAIGYPAMLKTRRLGYDGKGQRRLRGASDLEPAWNALGGVPLILEAWVPFEFEVSVIGVRGGGGHSVSYPISRNHHEGGMLRHCIAPYADAPLQNLADEYLARMFEHFDYAGVLTIEFFVHDGKLIANEMAPRVHNSGHWTIEGAVTSQFENHVRAVLGLPLGAADAIGHSGMVNFIGRLPPLERVLAVPGAHYHSYGKAPRPLRKLGHCTVNAPSAGERDRRLAEIATMIAASDAAPSDRS